jgi:hypothetical protein
MTRPRKTGGNAKLGKIQTALLGSIDPVSTPPSTFGQMNRPRSSFFVKVQLPWPSCQITFK